MIYVRLCSIASTCLFGLHIEFAILFAAWRCLFDEIDQHHSPRQKKEELGLKVLKLLIHKHAEVTRKTIRRPHVSCSSWELIIQESVFHVVGVSLHRRFPVKGFFFLCI